MRVLRPHTEAHNWLLMKPAPPFPTYFAGAHGGAPLQLNMVLSSIFFYLPLSSFISLYFLTSPSTFFYLLQFHNIGRRYCQMRSMYG